tara:strand:- start:23 stop:418 length:396 start_codon:yes stop_codon:yes gene_type:complete
VKEQKIVYFDGVCSLCNGLINFLIKIDRKKHLRYSSLQSDYAKKNLPPHQTQNLTTIIFICHETAYEKSDAISEIFRSIKGPWKIIIVLKLCPKVVRDALYNLIVKYRYKIFGKKKECRVPSKKEKELFLD